jgi:O-antigen ligase
MPDKLLVWLSLAALYLVPPLGGADFALRPIYLFYLCVPFLPGKSTMIRHLFPYGLFILSMLISNYWGYAALNVAVSHADFMEVIKLLIPVPAYLLGHLFFSAYRSDFVRQIFILSCAIVTITGLQFLKVADGLFSRLYSADSQLAAALGQETEYMRVVGISGNPNDAGMLFFFLQLFFLSAFFRTRKPMPALAWACCTAALVLTQSKTAYAAMGLALLVSCLLNRQYVFLTLVGGSLISGLLWFSADIAYVHNFMTAVRTEGLFSINVFSVRFDNARLAMEIWQQSSLLGWGVAKSIHPSIVDVEYFLLLRRYGLQGVLWLLILAASCLGRSHRDCRNHDDGTSICASFIFVATLSIPVFMSSNNFFSAYYNQYFYFMVLGMFACAQQQANSEYTENPEGKKKGPTVSRP